MMAYAYCESSTAGPLTPWHIRRVGPEGVLPGGGALAPICNLAAVWIGGWDIPGLTPSVEENDRQGSGVCQRCVVEFAHREATRS